MGLLDALIVPEEYRAQIRALDEKVCDRYIFSDVTHVKENLLRVLDVDNAENDILRYQNIANILSAIGTQEGGQKDGENTWVDLEGNYRIGILEGTITRDHTAHYIGVKARERFRAEKIAELEQRVEELGIQLAACEREITRLTEDKQRLQEEWAAFPSGEALKEAARNFADSSYELERMNRQITGLREQLQKLKTELDQIGLQVRESCGKCYLAPRLDVFQEALQSLGTYKELL